MAFTWWSLSFLECSSCLIISRPLCPSDTVLPGWRVFLAFHFALFPALDRKATTPPGTLIHLTNRLPGFLGALPIRNSEATVGGRGRCARRRPSFAGSATAGRLVFGGSLRVGPGTQMLSVEDTEELLRPATRDARGVGGTTPPQLSPHGAAALRAKRPKQKLRPETRSVQAVAGAPASVPDEP